MLITCIVLSLAVTLLMAEEASPDKKPIPQGYMLHLAQPNGWGKDPESAIKDLRERIFPMYERIWGHKPGFTIDWHWYALVEIADGRQWQADGRLWWYVPKTKTRNKRVTVGADRGLRTK